ncbi:MAG: hypothetical protein HC900_07865 [Methylacidiphilales bacterium]|nr:hypothetical protein [Candidatus Methylacidiphilales bacterium]
MLSPRRLVILAALTTAFSTPSAAETMSFKEAGAILYRSCGNDIERLCSNQNIGPGLRDCLLRKAASAQCKADIGRVMAGVERRAQARAAVLRVCDADIHRLCGLETRGDGHILECMIFAERSVSAKCNQAITDAGYK